MTPQTTTFEIAQTFERPLADFIKELQALIDGAPEEVRNSLRFEITQWGDDYDGYDKATVEVVRDPTAEESAAAHAEWESRQARMKELAGKWDKKMCTEYRGPDPA